MMKRTLSRLALALPAIALIAMPADAHRRWLLPSATVLSGDHETVSVDAATGNSLFNFDHHALGLDDLAITGPDGKLVTPDIIGKGKYRSVFDVPLDEQGTYRIALASEGMFGTYMLNGERKRWRGSAADAKAQIPAGASEVKLTPVISRVETFATLGAPNETALAPTGRGIEMVPGTHPNDLVAGEGATMTFLKDGKPAQGLDIEFVKGGTRYRDDAGVVHLTTDAEGQVVLNASEPGMYYLETSNGDPRVEGGGAADGGVRMSYAAVLEFLPG